MAVSGISAYNNAMYQWQNNQLKSTGNTSNSSSASMAASLLSGGSTSMTQQVASMVELTKYAMDAMGLSADSRVTFSQITRYREQLQQEFNAAVKNGLENSGLADVNKMSFEIDKNGAITAVGENADDRKKAQKWLDANPDFGKNLLSKLPEDTFENTSALSFKISSTGSINIVNKAQDELNAALSKKGDLAEKARDLLKASELEISLPVEFTFDSDGNIQAKGNNEKTEALNAWLKENPDFSKDIKEQLQKSKVDLSSVTLTLGKSGSFEATLNDAVLKDAQNALNGASDIGSKIYNGLKDLGIDKNITFSLQVTEDGKLQVISDHPDAAKMQQFFDDNPELVKKYRQIETLAGIDDARAAMQLSPSSMRRRIQVESMAAWWAGANNASSYFGSYNGGLSLLSGINLTA